MNLQQFSEMADLESKTELQKSLYLSYYLLKDRGRSAVSVADLTALFEELHFSRPNQSRLAKRMRQERAFVNGGSPGSFKIHATKLREIQSQLPTVGSKSEEILHDEEVLPESLYRSTRGYIEKLADQINASYESNIFDGCAVLMRRLLEICLILSYEKLGIASEIKDSDGNYKLLQAIVSNASVNQTLALSRNTKTCLEIFRTLGNFSAHKIHYNAKRADLQAVKQDYRACIEELLYKAGILR
ncbi:hypothetical protein [Desulfonatronovibrio hydrogenovorans]|uniref:hypothetical protein n=1 Tax=Desulfonatronovibrio hydrogenovorans TaxID=53245 RepID=UPI00048F4AC8|nr:hypothetical protein [Desulfonatronovibrio hydrogenovorans]